MNLKRIILLQVIIGLSCVLAFAQTSAGDLDTSFDFDGKVLLDIGSTSDIVFGVAEQADGKIVAAGISNGDFAIARYLTNGSLDESFGNDGKVTTDFNGGGDQGSAIAIQNDQKIIVVGKAETDNGTLHDFAIARYNTDGTLDNSFGNNGKVITNIDTHWDFAKAVKVQPDGKIVVGGASYQFPENHYDFALVRYNTDGSLDNGFGIGGISVTSSFANLQQLENFEILPNGKIVATGGFFNGNYNEYVIAKYNNDGSLDVAFDFDGVLTIDFSAFNDRSNDILVQSDGKIIIVGTKNNVDFPEQDLDIALARITDTGELDNTFGNEGIVTTDIAIGSEGATTASIQTDGKIIVSGYSKNGDDSDFISIRYNPDGSLDTNYGSNGIVITNINSEYDYVFDSLIQTDGKVLLGGISKKAGKNSFALVRYDLNGNLDNSFDGDGIVVTKFEKSIEIALGVAVQTDGKVITIGSYRDNLLIPNDGVMLIVRHNSDGTLDSSFGNGGIVKTDIEPNYTIGLGLEIQNDGKIVAFGLSSTPASSDIIIARYNSDGSLDATFGNDGIVITDLGTQSEQPTDIAIQADGKILLAGKTGNSTQSFFTLVRYNTNGSLDSSFGTNGVVQTFINSGPQYARSIAIQPDGKIVFVGSVEINSTRDIAILRYNTNGSLDTTFDFDGIVTKDFAGNYDHLNSVAIQTDGKIVASGTTRAGSNYYFATVRYNTNGSLDTTFRSVGIVRTQMGTGDASGLDLVIQNDGKINVGGVISGTDKDFGVARYNSDGTLDSTFFGTSTSINGEGGKAGIDFEGEYDGFAAMAITNSGKLVVAGQSTNKNSNGSVINIDISIARLLTESTAPETITISGRVKTRQSQGIQNALILMRDSQGNVRRTITDRRGFFLFDEIEVGQNYLMKASARNYTIEYATRVINVTENTPRIIFTAR